MNPCSEFRELIFWYIDGGLTKDEERSVARHLSVCEACRDDLVMTLRLRLDVRAALDGSPGMPARLRHRVMQKAFGRKLAQIDVGSFLLGFSLGASLRGRGLPIRGDLNVMGRKIRLFNTAKKGGRQ